MRWAIWMWLIAVPRLALAHATQPAVWELLSADVTGPTAVRLSEGLGLRESDGTWRFVCSTRWGGPVSPQVARLADGTFWLVSNAGERHLDGNAQVTGAIDVGQSTDTFHALATNGAVAVVLAGDATQATLSVLSLPAPRILWQDAQQWTSIAADGDDFWLAAARQTGFDLVRVQPDGQESRAHVDAPAGTPRLHVSRGTLFVTIAGDTVEYVGRVANGVWTEIAQSPPSVLGPELLDQRLFMAQGGVIREWTQTGMRVTDETRFFTCLSARDGVTYACARQDLRRLSPDGTAGQVLFDVALLAPPYNDGLTPAQQTECWVQWQNFAKDAGIAAGTFQSQAEAHESVTPAPTAGCVAKPQWRGVNGLALFLPLIVLWLVRRLRRLRAA